MSGFDYTLEELRRLDIEQGARCCRRCGCTDSYGCPEGCGWIEPDLCSACAHGETISFLAELVRERWPELCLALGAWLGILAALAHRGLL